MIALIDHGLTDYQQLLDSIPSPLATREQIFIISDVSWQDYQGLLTLLGDNSTFILKYSRQTLQVMSPSYRHEFYKEKIGILLEAYLQEKSIRFYSLGSTTFRSALTQWGIELDKSYCFKSRKNIPDLAIEIVLTSGSIDSLEIYQALGVPEVWFWQNNQLDVYYLNKKNYEKVNQSELLPGLDLTLFASYIAWKEPFDAVLAFRQKIRGN
ncbi:Uma2 family endonuclease [Synechocystis sp. PCC 7339]|uniref:Uma2 family endonuclease n=1 Tax=unclassified Synechocystis TaxID=2640012 RepID=UPI001BAEB304|nr:MULTISPECIES: Uma2 family endonuclease [unclassified Synechocystis]QUS60461.1 Uma2 family endonuclease [Synechocystis sp. PCC 7338]UAJ72098.1 Uma2 family endonuclease [Synechocystis sp. PCC 7339]